MIKTHCFEKEWIDGFKRQKPYSKINPPLLEKMIHALSLLQHLKKQGLPFIFKGGTSLLLLLENARRFSVDIDILTQASRQEVEQTDGFRPYYDGYLVWERKRVGDHQTII